MKLVFVVCVLVPLIAFSKEDTLIKRKFNVSVNAELLIPQTRSTTFYSDKSYPNSMYASPTRPIYGTLIYKNAWNVFANVEMKVFLPKLYFQTGLHCSKYSNVEYVYGDSLSLIKGTWGNKYVFTDETINISVPLGFSYRFNQMFFLSAGFVPSLYSVNIQGSTIYRGTSQLSPTDKNVMYSHDGSLGKYVTLNVRTFKRVYINIGLSNLSWKKDDLYYSVGLKYFII